MAVTWACIGVHKPGLYRVNNMLLNKPIETNLVDSIHTQKIITPDTSFILISTLSYYPPTPPGNPAISPLLCESC